MLFEFSVILCGKKSGDLRHGTCDARQTGPCHDAFPTAASYPGLWKWLGAFLCLIVAKQKSKGIWCFGRKKKARTDVRALK